MCALLGAFNKSEVSYYLNKTVKTLIANLKMCEFVVGLFHRITGKRNLDSYLHMEVKCIVVAYSLVKQSSRYQYHNG